MKEKTNQPSPCMLKTISHCCRKVLLILAILPAYTVSIADEANVMKYYEKMERMIPMRDGKKLFTAIYIPRDRSQAYPFLIKRTPYNVGPYGTDTCPPFLGPSAVFTEEKFIFVYQDVRGRFMSEGDFEDMRPLNSSKSRHAIDESTDMFDTMEWLLKNIKGHNGKAGVWGISYPGFYASMAAINNHPAIKAVSPQAPVTNWFLGDDFHHNGVPFLFDAFGFYYTFGVKREKPTTQWPPLFIYNTPDAYQWFLNAGTFKNIKDTYLKDSIKFWNDVQAHPDYDAFWKRLDVRHQLKNIQCATLVVGGLYDAENTWGAQQTYQWIEKQNPGIENTLVLGPWFHGAWERSEGDYFGDIKFNSKTSTWFLESIELPFFRHYLKGAAKPDLPEALVYDVGADTWRKFDQWPPANIASTSLYLADAHNLSFTASERAASATEYISDPLNPVPFTNEINIKRSREYMIEDQRFASRRPDVVACTTSVLSEDMTFAGPVTAELYISSTGTDADFVVKLIDVFPDTLPDYELNGKTVKAGGFEMLVRGEIMRARYRNSFEVPEPLKPGEITKIRFTLPEILHTFKRGHKIMVQVQSTWFPLADRNPQQFIDVYNCDRSALKKASHTVYHSEPAASKIELKRLISTR